MLEERVTQLQEQIRELQAVFADKLQEHRERLAQMKKEAQEAAAQEAEAQTGAGEPEEAETGETGRGRRSRSRQEAG